MGRMQDAMKRAAEEAGAGVRGPEQAAGDAAVPEEPSATAAAESGFAAETVVEVPPLPDDVDADAESSSSTGAPEGSAAEAGERGLATRFQQGLRAKVVVDHKMLASSREQYRRLAAALHHAQESSGVKVVMIASAVAGEGKSLTAANLALTFSESYKRSVLLIDGDLRRPSLHKMFKIDVHRGLSDALQSEGEPQLDVYELSDNLTIMPAGRPNSDPMAGLTSSRMRHLVEEARGGFEWVFIDTPPVGLLSDANLLSAMVDAAVLIIRANGTPYYLVERAVEAIGPDRILGTVLNRATATLHSYAYDYYRYYQAPRAESVQGG